jgi:hypothetical protein
MIGLGILEIGLLGIGASYIYALLSSKKNRIQYIELDENQFLCLQTTLVANNILPSHMLVNGNQNNTVIPPTYYESNLNYAITESQQLPSYSQNRPAELTVPHTEQTTVHSNNIPSITVSEETEIFIPDSNLNRTGSV